MGSHNYPQNSAFFDLIKGPTAEVDVVQCPQGYHLKEHREYYRLVCLKYSVGHLVHELWAVEI